MPKVTGTGRPDPTDLAIVEQLLGGATQREAARRCGVSERTVRRRLQDPGVQRRLMEEVEEAVKVVRRYVTAQATEALEVLGSIAKDEKGEARREGARTRVAAARAVLYAFVQLQPKVIDADVHTDGVPVIDYTIVGLDPEVFR